MTDPQAHELLVWRDDRGVIAWCSCQQWGYTGPDETVARDCHRTHVEEDTEEGGDSAAR